MEEITNSWFLIPYLFNLVLLAYINYNYREYVQGIFFSTISYGTSSKIYREYKSIKPRSAFLLNIMFIISIGIFAFQVIRIYFPLFVDTNPFLIIVIVISSVLILTFSNKIINYISGIIFLKFEISSEYNQNIDFFNQVLGLILFPITVLISFSDIPKVAVILGIIAFGLVYFLRILRLIKININNHLNIFYMFLYLCTVEILPILFILKTLILI